MSELTLPWVILVVAGFLVFANFIALFVYFIEVAAVVTNLCYVTHLCHKRLLKSPILWVKAARVSVGEPIGHCWLSSYKSVYCSR